MSELFTLTSGIEAALLESVIQGGVAMEIATAIAAEARATAPVVTGNYRDGIVVQATKHGARVLASDQKSTWVEFGIPSRGVAPQFVLRNAAESLGYKFKKSSN